MNTAIESTKYAHPNAILLTAAHSLLSNGFIYGMPDIPDGQRWSLQGIENGRVVVYILDTVGHVEWEGGGLIVDTEDGLILAFGIEPPPPPQRTVEEIRAEIAELNGELSSLEGIPIRVWSGWSGEEEDVPPGGALLKVNWCTSQHAYWDWYPTLEGAKAALLQLAQAEGRTPDRDGLRVNLTKPGCQSSSAVIQRRQ